jgi:type IV pilus assembly protein PilA
MLQFAMRHDAAEIERGEAPEGGFTLIELMVVLLIIAILLAIAVPTFLGVTNTAGDRAAQSNLTNALTESKALYQVNQTYSPTGGAYTPGQFSSQAPEFGWTTSSCGPSPQNCISYKVVDSSVSGDGQGLVLAAYSSKTSTCWYVVDLEAIPQTVPGTGFVTGVSASDKNSLTTVSGTSNAVGSAGVFYGKSKATSTCSASTGASPTSYALWGANYALAGYVY